MVIRRRRVLFAVLGVVLMGVAVGEHLYRRTVDQLYQTTKERQQQLEGEFAELLTTHHQASERLETERQRAQELAEALTEKNAQLNEAVARLAEQTRTVRELKARLAGMGQQMDQLQGELSLAIQRVTLGPRDHAGPIQLERVFIGNGSGQPGLQGRVVSVDENWSFVVIDLGWNSVKIGDTVSIFRHDQLLAKAQVERVQEGVAAATILPDWRDAQIQINDVVRIL